MAELVDALVSNTSGSNTVSVRLRFEVQKLKMKTHCLGRIGRPACRQAGSTPTPSTV
mgnify:CR=1 FL=1